jgi:hypothetical protein
LNGTYKRLMKMAPFLSVFFILIGVIIGVISISKHNIMMFSSSLIVTVVAVLMLINIKLFRKIFGK